MTYINNNDMFESLNKEADVIKFVPTLEEAVIPKRQRNDDVCWDLTLVKLISWEGNFLFFDSGVSLTPPAGYHFKIHPRSSIGKTGMILANSTGIIERSYTGSLKAGFWVMDWVKAFDTVVNGSNKGKDYELTLKAPFRCLQLELCREQPDFDIIQVEKLDDTIRGENGFGSSGFN